MLRYWSVLLYIVLILGVITLSGYINRKDHNFVIRGVKSVLSIGDIFIIFIFFIADLSPSVDDRNDFKHESVFQIYWAACNCLIVGILTALVKLPGHLLTPMTRQVKVHLQLDELFIVKSPSWFFTAIVCAIFATGILSLLAHFYLMKRQNTAPKSKAEEIEMHVMTNLP